jgi:hypothetical protein
VQKAGNDRLAVHAEVHQLIRHRDRMDHIWFTGKALLILMRFVRKQIRKINLFNIIIPTAAAQSLQ